MSRHPAYAVVDLGFGDAGKGTTVDWLCEQLVRREQPPLVVRFNGGAQAGHNVVRADGRHHTFSQIGAGAFHDGVRTHLAPEVVVHPTALLFEADALGGNGVRGVLERLTISSSCRVITPFHQAAGRLRELSRGANAHGTCGVGVGEAVRDALAHPSDAVLATHLFGAELPARLERVRERLREDLFDVLGDLRDDPRATPEIAVLENAALAMRWLALTRALPRTLVVEDTAIEPLGPIVMEGAQGTLLDEAFGFHPYTTWSRCTFAPAREWLDARATPRRCERWGVTRTYHTRHGPGPFPTETDALQLPEPHNGAGWQGAFRVGHLDLVLLRYAIEANGGVDGIVVTHCDRTPSLTHLGVGYEPSSIAELDLACGIVAGDLTHQEKLGRALTQVTPVLEPFADLHERLEALGAPVVLRSYGPTASDKVPASS